MVQVDLKALMENLVLKHGSGSYEVLPEQLTINFIGGQIRLDNIVGIFKRDPKGELDKEEEFVKIDSVNGALLMMKQPLLPPA